MKKFLMALTTALTMTGALAQTGTANPNTAVKQAVETVVKAAKADPASRAGDVLATVKVVERDFLPYTDFRRTTRLAVGAAWKTATPAQQQQLFEQFQTVLVHTYALQLTQLRGQELTFHFSPATLSANGTDAVVNTRVSGSGDDLEVGYRLGRTSEGWKIYDIDMMGAWLIQIYRQQFADQIARNGIDGLIKYLAAHNARFGK